MEKITISYKNTKMGKVPSVSLPPVITCRPGAACSEKCYAVKMERIYPSVKASYARNLRIWETDPDGYFAQIEIVCRLSSVFRFHVSGDIPNGDYWERVVALARRCRNCTILIFTKKYEIVNEWFAAGHCKPVNLQVIFSGWFEWQPENPYNLPMSQPYAAFPEENWKSCPGNCAECFCAGSGCWMLKKGETVAFKLH